MSFSILLLLFVVSLGRHNQLCSICGLVLCFVHTFANMQTLFNKKTKPSRHPLTIQIISWSRFHDTVTKSLVIFSLVISHFSFFYFVCIWGKLLHSMALLELNKFLLNWIILGADLSVNKSSAGHIDIENIANHYSKISTSVWGDFILWLDYRVKN